MGVLNAIINGAKALAKKIAIQEMERRLKKNSLDSSINMVFIGIFVLFALIILIILCNPFSALILSVIAFIANIPFLNLFFGLNEQEIELAKKLNNSQITQNIKKIQNQYGIENFDYGEDIDELIEENEENEDDEEDEEDEDEDIEEYEIEDE